MTAHNVVTEIYYPESDGEPMAETDLHRNWMIRIIDILQHRFEGQQVYVSGNLLLYYVEGDPTKSVSPDALVVKGVAPGLRRTYKVWEEGKAPDVVFETTSDSTRQNDTQKKFELYAQARDSRIFSVRSPGRLFGSPAARLSAGRNRLRPD